MAEHAPETSGSPTVIAASGTRYRVILAPHHGTVEPGIRELYRFPGADDLVAQNGETHRQRSKDRFLSTVGTKVRQTYRRTAPLVFGGL